MGEAKAVLKGKFVELNAYRRKDERSKETRKRKNNKSKVSRRKKRKKREKGKSKGTKGKKTELLISEMKEGASLQIPRYQKDNKEY